MKHGLWISTVAGIALLNLSSLAHANEGVSHGGGGGTTNPVPASDKDIGNLANLSSTQVTAFLRGIETSRILLGHLDPQFKHPEFDKLFNDPALFEKLKSIKIHVSSAKPCTDFDGNEVDGSTNTGAPDTICLSVQRLKSKLTFEQAKTEVPALVLHEISHLFGTNENEAVAIQTAAKTPFSLHSADDWRHYASQVSDSLDSLVMASQGVQSVLENNGKITCSQAQKLAALYAQTMNGYVGGKDNLMLDRETDVERYGQTEVRAAALADYLCSQDSSATADQRAAYAKAFGTRTQMSAPDYQDAVLFNGKPQAYERYGAYPIQLQRLNSQADAAKDLAGTISEISALKNQISDDNPSTFMTIDDPNTGDQHPTTGKVACKATLYSRGADGAITVLQSADVAPEPMRIGFIGHMGTYKLVARIDESWEDESGHIVTDNPTIQFEAWPDAGGPNQIHDEAVRDLGSAGRGFDDLPSDANHVSWICRLK